MINVGQGPWHRYLFPRMTLPPRTPRLQYRHTSFFPRRLLREYHSCVDLYLPCASHREQWRLLSPRLIRNPTIQAARRPGVYLTVTQAVFIEASHIEAGLQRWRGRDTARVFKNNLSRMPLRELEISNLCLDRSIARRTRDSGQLASPIGQF
jgi:hypothetical protein